MYICDFSRSDGAGKATSRNTRGLTRSVMALMVPPLPAASRPSKTMMTRRPLCLTHSCSLHNSPWSLRRCFRYFLFFSFLSPSAFEFLLINGGVGLLLLLFGGNLVAWGGVANHWLRVSGGAGSAGF